MIPAGGSSAPALDSVRVTVLSVGTDGTCQTRDTLGKERQVRFGTRAKGVAAPLAGEIWVIRRATADVWVLAEMVNSPEPVLLASIDPAYLTGLPKVVIAGALSTGTYRFLESYLPVAGDQVLLVRIGAEYLIAGRVDNATRNLVARVTTAEGQITANAAAITAIQAFDLGLRSTVTRVTNSTLLSTGAETIWTALNTSRAMVSGVTYKVTLCASFDSATANTPLNVRLRDSRTASAPTTASTLISRWQVTPQIFGESTVLIDFYACDLTGTHVLGVSIARLSGGGDVSALGDSDQGSLTIEPLVT